jgi:chloramphenicol O-acetyltransferase
MTNRIAQLKDIEHRKMILDIVKLDDLKVYAVNTLCVILLRLKDMTPELSALLLITTIIYTVVRIANEVQKFRNNGKGNKGSTEEDS